MILRSRGPASGGLDARGSNIRGEGLSMEQDFSSMATGFLGGGGRERGKVLKKKKISVGACLGAAERGANRKENGREMMAKKP